MSAPFDPVYLQRLHEWQVASQELKALKEREMQLRKVLASAFFPTPSEGTNTLEIGNGYKLKGVFGMDRKVDEAALKAADKALRDAGVPLDDLVRWKPDLSITEYRKLDDQPEKKVIFDMVIITKPSSPSLEIVPPKNKD